MNIRLTVLNCSSDPLHLQYIFLPVALMGQPASPLELHAAQKRADHRLLSFECHEVAAAEVAHSCAHNFA